MRPISELAGHAAQLRGIFSDIDDTLTHDGALVPEAYAALVRAKEAGLRIVLVTGRPAGWAEVLANIWPVDAAIAENGGIAYLKRGRRLERLYYAPGDPAEEQRRLAALCDEVLRTVPVARRTDDANLRATDIAFDIGEALHLAPAEIDQITSRLRELGARTLVSSVHAHGCFHEADKAKMSARVAEVLWGEAPAEVAGHYAFIGDSPNDQAAFAFFETAIGVANVARYADVLRPPPGGHGFAEALDVILAAR
jgi:HAD superfamily hydrolase (TIGR01484 family)